MDRFDKIMLSVIVSAIVCTAIAITTCTLYSDYKIGEAIAGGANPVQAKYAFKNTEIAEDVMAWRSLEK